MQEVYGMIGVFILTSPIMHDTDSLQRFMFEHASIRGEIVHLDNAYQTIMRQRPYPPAVKQLLGEALLAAVLLTASIKFEGEISLQFHGDKRLPLLLVQCDNQLQIRGFAKYQEEIASVEFPKSSIDYHGAFLEGKMVLNITPFNQTQTYQSVVPITSVNMSENIMHYFAQSEQISTQILFAINEGKAAGMLLQLMPGQNTIQREQFWEYAVHIGQTLTEQELLTLDNITILHRLYHETEVRLYNARPVRFQCRCSPEKMKQVLTLLGEEDVRELIKEKGQVEVNCDFCNQQYAFDAIDVTLLFRK